MIRNTITIIIVSALFSLSYYNIVIAELSDQSDLSALLSEGKFAAAEKLLNTKLSVNGKDAVTLSLLGEVCRQRGAYNKSLKYLNKAISVDPNYPDSYMYKGKLYFSMQKFDDVPKEFSAYIQRMEYLTNDDAASQLYVARLHEISVIYFALKEYEYLKSSLDLILKLSPNDQTATYNLGVYYYTYERNRSKAYSSFSKVIEMDPVSQYAAKAKYAIEFMRANPDSRVAPNFSFIDQEFRS